MFIRLGVKHECFQKQAKQKKETQKKIFDQVIFLLL